MLTRRRRDANMEAMLWCSAHLREAKPPSLEERRWQREIEDEVGGMFFLRCCFKEHELN